VAPRFTKSLTPYQRNQALAPTTVVLLFKSGMTGCAAMAVSGIAAWVDLDGLKKKRDQETNAWVWVQLDRSFH
jgi:hypothetical protein